MTIHINAKQVIKKIWIELNGAPNVWATASRLTGCIAVRLGYYAAFVTHFDVKFKQHCSALYL